VRCTADLAAVLLEQDAGIFERAPRLSLAQEGAVQVALVSLFDLGVGDQVVKEVRTADRMDMVVRRGTELVLDLAPDVVALLLDHPRRRAGGIEVEIDLGVLADAEASE
jgi:hypothetical protein